MSQKRAPLKPGEKIKFEGSVHGTQFFAGAPAEATVIAIYDTNARWPVETLKVHVNDCGTEYEGTIARRQVVARIRKKPRPPKERGKFISKRFLGNDKWADVHWVELRPGEVPVSREALAKAWDSADSDDSENSANGSRMFKEICEALGLPGKEQGK